LLFFRFFQNFQNFRFNVKLTGGGNIMKLLVTGGAGFIGSHIVEGALEQGWEVAVLDDLSNGRRENVPLSVRFYEVDIRDAASLEAAFADFKPEVVSHQAAQASVAVSVREPLLDANINVIGGLNVLECARKHFVKRVLFASTGGAIYGEVPDGQKASPSWPALPQSPYATAKLAFERYLATYHIQYGLESSILRYANVYGPRQDPHGEAGVVAIFARRLLEAQPIRVYARKTQGDAGCVRDYVYVSDVVRANLAAARGELSLGTLNIGTGVATPTLEIARSLECHLGVTGDVGYGPQRPGDVEYSVLDESDFVRLLGPLTALEGGLEQTAQWFKTHV